MRAACCMLWVTMTIVYSFFSSLIRSSTASVEIGSRAEQGSSISRTCGCTATARAMHRRCCWPPDRPMPGLSRRSLTSFHRLAPRRAHSTRSSASDLEILRLFRRTPASTFSRMDIVGNGFGRWKTMPTSRRTSTGSTSLAYRLRPSSSTSPLTWAPGMISCMRSSVRSTVDLPQPEGPMKAVTLFGSMFRLTSSTARKSP